MKKLLIALVIATIFTTSNIVSVFANEVSHGDVSVTEYRDGDNLILVYNNSPEIPVPVRQPKASLVLKSSTLVNSQEVTVKDILVQGQLPKGVSMKNGGYIY